MIGRQAGEKLSIVVLSRHIFTSSIWKNQYKAIPPQLAN